MGFVTPRTLAPDYDVIVVGSAAREACGACRTPRE